MGGRGSVVSSFFGVLIIAVIESAKGKSKIKVVQLPRG